MERINIPASIQNLDNMNKLQSRENNMPLNHQLKNEEEQMKDTAERLHKANEAEKAEKEKVDEKKKREEKQKQKRKIINNREDAEGDDENGDHRINRGSSSGKFIDYSA